MRCSRLRRRYVVARPSFARFACSAKLTLRVGSSFFPAKATVSRGPLDARPSFARFACSAKLTSRVGSSFPPRRRCRFLLAALFARLRFSRRYVATSAFGSAHRKRHAFAFRAVAPFPRESHAFAGTPWLPLWGSCRRRRLRGHPRPCTNLADTYQWLPLEGKLRRRR